MVPDGLHPQMLRELPAAISRLLLIILKYCGHWEKQSKTGGQEMPLQTLTVAGRRTQGTIDLSPSPCKGDGAHNPGNYFQAHEGQEGNWE